MSTLIVLSTFFVKQHALLDALAGFVLVEIVYFPITRFEVFFKPIWNKTLQENVDFLTDKNV